MASKKSIHITKMCRMMRDFPKKEDFVAECIKQEIYKKESHAESAYDHWKVAAPREKAKNKAYKKKYPNGKRK